MCVCECVCVSECVCVCVCVRRVFLLPGYFWSIALVNVVPVNSVDTWLFLSTD